MLIASGIFLSLIESLIITMIWKKYNLLQINCSKPKYLIPITLITVLSSIINILLLLKKYAFTTCINIFVLYTLLFAIAGIDFKLKIIPNKLLLIGILIRSVIIGVEAVLHPENVINVLLNSGIGFIFGLLFFLFLSFISKHGIGYGDVKLFAWIGLCMGISDTYSIMFYSVCAAAVVGLYLLFIKSKDKKTQIPFGPFVFVGLYMVLCFRLM